ncbi:MAG: DUF1972 domain-containing protein [Candidatus Marinimicrobia bacterium]|nr:DUF1972 domain-containing protein [Candidatus Neomarinimicrobiota bacterium]MCF7828781.1 DUF1972 domain-containing protein [Candidatus Neomarinimicrobiota bacterium]MCF7880698.1 DUF1972 domain-containing protein [Candidatus Neomarinimicrobiota bacterium]
MLNTKRIAIIGTRGYPYVYSGYETFIRELLGRLNHKFDFHVYCHRQLFENKPKKVNNVTLHYLPAIQKKSLSQLSNSILSTMHALFMRYNMILYVNTANGPLGLLTKIFGTKTAIITDGLEWERPKWEGIGGKYFLWASQKATKYMDVLISDSKEMKKVYEKKFNADSVVIAYGANLVREESQTTTDAFINFCKIHGLKARGYYLIVGRLVPDNNAELLIEGFHKSNSTKKLVIVGDTPYHDQWASRVKSYMSDKIIFTGYIRDQNFLNDLFLKSYVYLHGHEYGGTNPSLLTALSKRCAVLALDTRFSREVLLNGQYGRFFEKNVQSLREQIESLEQNENLVDKLKRSAPKRIQERYTWEKIAKQYEELFQITISG